MSYTHTQTVPTEKSDFNVILNHSRIVRCFLWHIQNMHTEKSDCSVILNSRAVFSAAVILDACNS